MQDRDLDHGGRERRPTDAPTRHAPSGETLASLVGNRSFASLARSGAGILDGGRVHPEVESAIASNRGHGGHLDEGVRSSVAQSLGDPLSDVRVHTGAEADGLARSVDAKAFTVGSDMFFARGEYRPGSAEGNRLIAHELTHVVQQRGTPASGPLVVSDPGDVTEREADQVSHDLAG